MFGFSFASELIRGSADRTWNCVSQFANLVWFKFNYLRHPIMPRSRRRHHSRSRSRSRSHSHERDRDNKRRKIEVFESPNHKRSVSAEPEEVIVLDDGSPEEETVETVKHEDPEKTEESMETDDKKDSSLAVFDSSISSSGNEEETKSDLKKLDVDKSNTPKKALTPKQIQRKLDSEKKRVERQKERDEKERKKNEEKERLRLEKLKQREEKRKEREEKEELKRKEKEEKEIKRKEKEEREEQKRKEKELEKLKRQQEQEEKNKEKQKIEEQKQKAAAAFVNFFVTKKVEGNSEEKKCEENKNTLFKDFEVKSDMRLAPLRRKVLTDAQKNYLTESIKEQANTAAYLVSIKNSKIVGKSGKTWPYEDGSNDVTIIEDDTELGETICEEKPKSSKMKAKFLKFHENRRPAYFGTWRKKTGTIKPRKPFNTDTGLFNYEEDSDDDWEEEEQGESLDDSDGEEKENEEEKDDYEVDNEFFVPHGHLSDDEVDDEENSKLSPESLKQKLKLLKDEFDEDMKSKTNKIKPRSVGCIWYNKNGDNVDEAIDRYLRPLAVITLGRVFIKKRDLNSQNKNKQDVELDPELVPKLLKFLHGNNSSNKKIAEDFTVYMVNNGFTVNFSKARLRRNIKQMAQWIKCPEEGPMRNKYCWYVAPEVREKYNLDLTISSSK